MADEEFEDRQWTEETRQRFAAEVEALVRAVRRHGAAVLAASGRRADIPRIIAAGDELSRAASAYADAQFEFTGVSTRFGVDEEDDQTDDEDEEPEDATVAAVLLVHRAEYAVTDLDAVLAAGRAAYRQVWPDDTDDDAAADVTGFGRALYQVQHAGGLAALDRVPGLAEVGTSTWILDATDEDGRRAVLEAALGSVEEGGHEWDEDPAGWVRRQRSGG